MTSRELVLKTLNKDNPKRAPRQMWSLPWAEIHYPQELEKIKKDFPDDIVSAAVVFKELPKTVGNAYEIGEYIDEWGCKFINKQRGVIGEVKEPLIKDEEWEDRDLLRIPEELLTVDIDRVNEFCRNTDKFVMAGACPRPFEQIQFIRGTEQLYMDLMLKPDGLFKVLERMHDFYCRLLELWAKTEVDALMFMDDWGSQRSLLINPKIWVELFKPMYKDYIDIAHKHGKKIFMHSDGYILDIIPHLIEIGLDAVNSQLFCMGVEKLKPYAGKITFWGEIDRQNLLPRGTTVEIVSAVKLIKETLWQNGGCIAQLEFGPGAKPENAYTAFRTWNEIV